MESEISGLISLAVGLLRERKKTSNCASIQGVICGARSGCSKVIRWRRSSKNFCLGTLRGSFLRRNSQLRLDMSSDSLHGCTKKTHLVLTLSKPSAEIPENTSSCGISINPFPVPHEVVARDQSWASFQRHAARHTAFATRSGCVLAERRTKLQSCVSKSDGRDDLISKRLLQAPSKLPLP